MVCFNDLEARKAVDNFVKTLTAAPHLQEQYQRIQEEIAVFNNYLNKDAEENLPRYVSVPRYCDENELDLSYEDQCEMANIAYNKSRYLGTPIRRGETPIGELNCYLEEILEAVLEDMEEGDCEGCPEYPCKNSH
jgi:hypothetical protein